MLIRHSGGMKIIKRLGLVAAALERSDMQDARPETDRDGQHVATKCTVAQPTPLVMDAS